MDSDDKFWTDKRVFVTGGTGLLGSWMVKELLRRRASVVVLIRDLVADSELFLDELLSNITVVLGDLSDLALLERILNEYEIETIFHLAAQTIVGTANRSPISTFESNIRGTWNLLEAARKSNVLRQVIVASSDKAYGDHDELPYLEDAPLRGKHPYDVSKSCADLIAQSYAYSFDLPICITRCGNLFGGGDLNWNRLIPGTIRSALRGERPIIRSNGTNIRDYFYVEDGVAAYLKLAELMENDAKMHGEAFNFSNETRINVLDLTRKILSLVGREEIEPVVMAEANNEILHQYLDSGKAREILNWQPAYSLEAGLTRTIDWYRLFIDSKN